MEVATTSLSLSCMVALSQFWKLSQSQKYTGFSANRIALNIITMYLCHIQNLLKQRSIELLQPASQLAMPATLYSTLIELKATKFSFKNIMAYLILRQHSNVLISSTKIQNNIDTSMQSHITGRMSQAKNRSSHANILK